MNKRERILLFTLVGILIVVGGWAGFYFVYQKPMAALDKRAKDAQKKYEDSSRDIDKGNAEHDQVLQRDPHLSQWRLISLPEAKGKAKTPEEAGRHVAEVQGEYQKYLFELMRKSGFAPATINVSPKEVDNKSSPTIPGKGPVYTRLSYQLQGEATLTGVVHFMRDFHEAHLLQEVHTLSVTKPLGSLRAGATPPVPGAPAPGAPVIPGLPAVPRAPQGPGQRPAQGGRAPEELLVTMSVEALIVSGAEVRPDLMPKTEVKIPEVLARKPEEYDDILRKNFFMGSNIGGARLTSREDPNEILRNVRLTTVSYGTRGRWEGYILNVYNEKEELKLSVDLKADFSVYDSSNIEILKGKVLLVADRTFVFEANGKVYKLATGDHLFPAIEHPLKNYEIRELGLTPPPDKAEAAKPTTPVATVNDVSPE